MNKDQTETPTRRPLQRLVRKSRATDKSVRDNPVIAKLKLGQIIVEQPGNGVLFSFPAAVWPHGSWKQAQWLERLTPWWDLDAPNWTAQCQRHRDACRGAINKLLNGADLPENLRHPATDGPTGNSGCEVTRRPILPNAPAHRPGATTQD